MATEAELKALDQMLDFIKGNSQYYDRRAQCMSGFQAKSIRERRDAGMVAPDTGALCLELLKHSAAVDADPKAKAARPDQDLLGPWRAVSADKGFNATNSNAEKLVYAYHETQNLPNVKNTYPTVDRPMVLPIKNPTKGTVENFYLTQGTAFDAAFTVTVLDAVKSGKAPSPSNKYDKTTLQSITDACFKNAIGTTFGQCSDAGIEQAAQFIKQSPKVIAR